MTYTHTTVLHSHDGYRISLTQTYIYIYHILSGTLKITVTHMSTPPPTTSPPPTHTQKCAHTYTQHNHHYSPTRTNRYIYTFTHIHNPTSTRLQHIHTLRASLQFRHPPPNSARFSYTTEGALFISAQLSTDAVSALRKARVLI